MILVGLCDAAAARMSKPRTRQQQAAFPLMMLLSGRLRRLITRFAALAANPIAAPPPPRDPAKPRTRKPSEPKLLPSGFGWLVKLLPEAAVFGSQLQHFLTDPEMAAMIATNPKIAGLLRPLCRMLAVPGPPKPAPVKAAEAGTVEQSATWTPDSVEPGPCPEKQDARSSAPTSPLRPGESFVPTESRVFERA